MTKAIFILFYISIGLEISSVRHTTINENSELNVFKNNIFGVKYLIIDQMIYLEQPYTIILSQVGNYCYQYCNGLIRYQYLLNEVLFLDSYLYLFSFWVPPSNFIVSGVKSGRMPDSSNSVFYFVYIYSY